jgi:membrane protein DedA with SNARE-associated domain
MLLAAHGAPVSMIFVGGLYAALGSVTGSSLTYWLARLGGRPVVDRVARWCRIDPRHITRAEKSFQRWGPELVLLGRMLPGLRTLITIPAGLARMPFLQYVGFTFIGSYLWCTLLIGLGYAFGHEWPLISDWVKQFMPWLLATCVAVGGLALLARWLLTALQKRPACVPVLNDDEERRLP